MLVWVLGISFNMLNILVLTHKDMRSLHINVILTGIAVADCLVMLEYIPFTVHMYLLDYQYREREEKVGFKLKTEGNILVLQFSYGWAVFLLFHTNFTVMIHTVSTWLTLSLAIWRFIMIKFPTWVVSLCTDTRCRLVLTCGYGKYEYVLRSVS